MGLSGMCLRLVAVEMLLLMVAEVALATTQLAQAKPGCPSKCGDHEIPYPFGTKPGCYLNKNFLITCNDIHYDPPKPFYLNSNLEVTRIDREAGRLQIQSLVAVACHYTNTTFEAQLGVGNSTTISDTQNKFRVIGCDSYGLISGKIDNKNYTAGCVSWCNSPDDYLLEGSCSGSGCCQIDIPKGLQEITVRASRLHAQRQNIDALNPCTQAFVVEDNRFNFSSSNLFNMTNKIPFSSSSSDLFNTTKVPTVVDWAITGHGKCEEENKTSGYACKENALCKSVNNSRGGYLCKCKDGYRGNPYLSNGCQDINECQEKSYKCRKNAHCVNSPGNYACKCNSGYHGNGSKDGDGCIPNQLPIEIFIGIGLGFVILFVGSSWLYFMFRKRRLIKLKEKFFQQNGGFLLQQQLSKRNRCSNAAKIFSAKELNKATNNFDRKRIIGRGGYGIVYKGFLKDNNPVAIKKSKIVDQSQIEQFINEVTILSQINHRNVVKLLGCCLEREVPLLVYEYVNNGTLFDHIHNKDKARTIPWETRLRIATETAGVLSYLHSAVATPIIHRDVKSTNILLDDTFITKVSDFGASKLVPMDVTQLSTMVQGTLGYLDLEYLHTSQLTEKSDVYSFGVVLVELMTAKKVVSFDRPEEERSLVNHFLFLLKEGSFFEILESGIANDDNTKHIKEVAELARRCLNLKGEGRPTMKEVAMELEGLRSNTIMLK